MVIKRNNQDSLLKTSMTLNVLMAVIIVVLGVTIFYIGVLHQTTTIVQTSTQTTSVASTIGQSNKTLAGIDQPFNSTELASINGEPLSYYEYAGQLLLNGSIANEVPLSNSIYSQYNALIINGKPSVVYVGAISCVFCGENRWAMALALATFGNFTQLFQGYSAIGDSDVPTIYWIADNYTTTAGVGYGNYYNSTLINFFSSDYQSPITGAFQVGPLSYFIQRSPNSDYTQVLTFMNSTNKFQGTPFTFWGTSLVTGADAVVFGNSSQSESIINAGETHAQILAQFKNFNDQFAWSEYAGADVYIAQVCPSINNTAEVCQLPAIKTIGSVMGLTS
jgi:hypothetical protein